MALKNKSMYAILGILNLLPCTGYDIKKFCDKVLSSFWNENFGHIYPTLKMLSEAKMIEAVDSSTKDKKVCYRITDIGRRELEEWISEETLWQPMRSEFMLKLFFSSSQPSYKVIEMLENYKELYVNNINKYNVMLEELNKGIPVIQGNRVVFYKAVLRRGILSSEAVIRWCEETIDELK